MMWLKLNQRDIVGLRFAVDVFTATTYLVCAQLAPSAIRYRAEAAAQGGDAGMH